jgi:PAS domain S-box-containing protein
MDQPAKSRLTGTTAIRIAAAIAGAIALTGWLRWWQGPSALDANPDARPSTNPTTALSLVLAALALWLLTGSRRSATSVTIVRLFAILIGLGGVARLAAIALGIRGGIDVLFFPAPYDLMTDSPVGRMAATTALSLACVGLALGQLTRETARSATIAQLLAVTVVAIGMLRLVGFAYGASGFSSIPPYAAMSPITAIAIVLIALGTLGVRSNEGLMRVFTTAPGSRAARRLLANVFAVPLVLGWIGVQLQHAGLFDPDLVISLVIGTTMALLVGLIWMHATTSERANVARVTAEEAVRTSEERFRTVASTASDAIVTADRAGKITYVNAAAEQIFGRPASTSIGEPLTVLMPDEFHAAHQAGMQRYLDTGVPRIVGHTVELIGQRADGSRFPLELSLGAGGTGDDVTFTAILRDITERKRWAEDQERLRRELQEYVDHMSTMSAKVATDGRIIMANAIAQQASGFTPEQLIGADFLAGPWWAFDPAVQRRVRDSFARAVIGHPVQYEEKLFAFGTVIDISFSLMPVRKSDGSVDYIIAEGRDITVLRRTQDVLAQRTRQLEEANQELESFSYSVAHDLRAPLRTIDGFSRILEQDHGAHLEGEGKRVIGVIRRGTQQMGQLIEDLLAFSRITRTALTEVSVDMTALATAVVDEVRAAETERKIEFDVQPLPPARGDRALLRQVFTNLVQNAVKFTRGRNPAFVEITGRAENGEHFYTVADNGVGFDEKYASKLFGVFQRLHRIEDFEGTGVGLAIVQRVIRRHGGRVWAESTVEQGATFHFTLPSTESGT